MNQLKRKSRNASAHKSGGDHHRSRSRSQSKFGAMRSFGDAVSEDDLFGKPDESPLSSLIMNAPSSNEPSMDKSGETYRLGKTKYAIEEEPHNVIRVLSQPECKDNTSVSASFYQQTLAGFNNQNNTISSNANEVEEGEIVGEDDGDNHNNDLEKLPSFGGGETNDEYYLCQFGSNDDHY